VAPTCPRPIAGQVYLEALTNSDKGRGIEGAQVFIFKEGLSATEAAADDTVTRNEVIATGLSDASGLYRTDAAIPRGRAYSVIIIARGYRPIVADEGIDVPSGATNPYQVDATLETVRRPVRLICRFTGRSKLPQHSGRTPVLPKRTMPPSTSRTGFWRAV
jgi:hypothetical protein